MEIREEEEYTKIYSNDDLTYLEILEDTLLI